MLLFAGRGWGQRAKVVGGTLQTQGSVPFVAALLICDSAGPGQLSCGQTCTGSLIGPNVVLTAAHCVRPAFVAMDSGALNTASSRYYVLLGSASISIPAGARLVRVKSIRYSSYGENLRFPFDGDVAVLELISCVSEVPGVIEYASVATIDSQPESGTCASVTIAGFGRSSNAPAGVNDSDGKLRAMSAMLHSAQACKDNLVALFQGLDVPNYATADAQDVFSVLPELTLCTGGNTLRSACFGDSGGPVFSSTAGGRKQVIGITSFLISSGTINFCSIGPEYSTRVAFHAKWIKDQIDSFTTCPDWTVDRSFASWPVSAWTGAQLSPAFTASRCTGDGQWQCQDGACIDAGDVCDSTFNCADQTDELYRQNSVSLCPRAARRLCEQTAILDDPGVDLDNVVFVGPADRTAARVSMAVRPVAFAVSQSVALADASVSCLDAIAAVNAAITAARAQDTTSDEWDFSELEDVCQTFKVCAPDVSAGTADYTSANKFCSSMLEYGALVRYATSYSESFLARLEPTCLPDAEEPTVGDPVVVATLAPDGATTVATTSTGADGTATTRKRSGAAQCAQPAIPIIMYYLLIH